MDFGRTTDKKILNVKTMSKIIDNIVGACFKTDDNGNTEYLPHLREITVRLSLIAAYLSETPNEDEDLAEFAYSDKFEEALRFARRDQIDDIYAAAQERIDFLKSRIISLSNERIVAAVLRVAEKEDPLQAVSYSLANAIDVWAEKFEGVDMKQLTEDVKGMKIDPSALMQAYMRERYPDGIK